MKRITFPTFAVLLLLASVALTACKRPKGELPVSNSNTMSVSQPPRVTLMPKKSNENHRTYTDLSDGSVMVQIAFLDGTVGELRGRSVGLVKPIITSAREVQTDKKSVTYTFQPNSNIIESLHFHRADGTLHAVRTFNKGIIIHTYYASDGQTLQARVEDGGEGYHKQTLWQEDGQTLRGVVESYGEKKNLLTSYGADGKLVYSETALQDRGDEDFSLYCEWYQNGKLVVKETWHSNFETESGIVPVLFEKFNGAGKAVLRIVPAVTDPESDEVERWQATTIGSQGEALTTIEAGSLEAAGFPEGPIDSTKEIARKLSEEADDLLIELEDHSTHFQRL